MKRKDYIQYKAIETLYQGYRFRSRLEARWGVFFDTLDISWDYEKEGFDLNGTYYLPDFWLPDQDCWIEIKGQEPTEEEMHKARELALCTRKFVFIISGNIAAPDAPYLQDIRLEIPPSVCKMNLDDVHNPRYQEIAVSSEVLAVIQMLKDAYMYPSLFQGQLLIESINSCIGSKYVPRFAEKLQIQACNFPKVAPLLEKYESDLIQVLTVDPGWSIDIHERHSTSELEWVECARCHEVTIGFSRVPHDCPSETGMIKLDWVNDSPRIVAAYTAARQARFEHKKSRSEASK